MQDMPWLQPGFFCIFRLKASDLYKKKACLVFQTVCIYCRLSAECKYIKQKQAGCKVIPGSSLPVDIYRFLYFGNNSLDSFKSWCQQKNYKWSKRNRNNICYTNPNDAIPISKPGKESQRQTCSQNHEASEQY